MPNIERLEHLVKILSNIPKEIPFNLKEYVSFQTREGRRTVNSFWRPDSVKPEACGTAVCAVGYGALDPVFIAQGLRLQPRREGDGSLTTLNSVEEFNAAAKDPDVFSFFLTYTDEKGELHIQGEAGTRFFDMDEDDYDAIFQSTSYPRNRKITPAAVIKRIRKYISEHS